MISKPMDILSKYPVRKTKQQKKAFREDVCEYLSQQGYTCTVESGSCGVNNIVIGNPDTAKHVITAHYDTPAGMPFPNLITPVHALPFILWQLIMLILLAIIPVTAGITVGYMLNSSSLGYNVGYFVLFVEMALMMYGPANKSNANDNTSGVVTVVETARCLPKEKRDEVCFVLFDLEEAGLLGSSHHAYVHSEAVKHQIVLNLDCVGEGNHILFFPNHKLKKDKVRMGWLRKCVGISNCKYTSIVEEGFAYYPSDQRNFPLGVGIATLKRAKNGWLYLDKIHTKKDITLEKENYELLSAKIIGMVIDDSELPPAPIVDTSKAPKKKIPVLGIFFGCLFGCLALGTLAGYILVKLFP